MTDKNYTLKMGVDVSELRQAKKEISSSLKEISAGIKYATVASADYNSRLELLNKNVKENAKMEDALRKELEKLRSAQTLDLEAIKKKNTELLNQQTRTELARQDLERFTEAHEKAIKAEDNHAIKLNTLSYVLSDLAATLAKKACKALVDFTKETINTGMQFESAFAGVKKVTSGTEEDFKKLETEIRKTALEKPISADQLASIYQMGSQLGIAKDSLKDFSNSIIDLAKTSDLTEEAGATMIAQYANVTGLKPEEYRKFASTLSYLGSTTATTESTIMDFASRISGSAKLIGMSHQEILALSTALGSVGINAEMGGSAISKIMNSIDVAVDKNSKELQTWAQVAGVSSSEFASKWKTNVSEAFQDVLTGMTKFKDEGGSLNLLLEELDIKNIRQTETLKKLANASELLAEDMSKANDEWEKAAFLGDSAGQVYNTVESQMQLLRNSFAEMQISIYEGLKEPLAEAMKELSNLLKSNEIKAFGQVISTVMKTAINLVTLVIKNMKTIIPVLSGIITKMLILKAIELKSTIVAGLKGMCEAVKQLIPNLISATSAQLGLNTAMNANPIGLITTLIGLLVGGLIGLIMNYKDANEEIKAHTKALEEQRDQLVANREEREKTIAGIDAEANKTQALVNELKTLVDENGRVKEGQQDRINTILPLIQQYTGVEIECINGQITKYNELIGTLDQVIAKKRLEAKINAYQGDYEEAIKAEEETKSDRIKYVSELIKKEDELERYQKDIAAKRKKTGLGYYGADAEIGRRKNEIAELKKQIELYDESAKERKEVIDKYEGLITEQYNTFGNGSKTATNTGSASNAGSAAGQAYVQGFSSAAKEGTKTTYQELLNQEKAYGDQLNDYLSKVKDANSGVTVEMVQDTKKKLDEVQKKVKDMKELLGDNTVTSKLVLNDETYGGLNRKREELKTQLAQMQTELANGNQSITQDMLNNVGKQIDQIDAKIKNLKNEWDENGNDGEISDEFESENANHVSKGVIFG
ncbi:MAG: phage tail tape measure protein, partial [Lachnospiraceae bacterium]|nr:phage tail tape measure protein [Lachnospiraceae bacterium]